MSAVWRTWSTDDRVLPSDEDGEVRVAVVLTVFNRRQMTVACLRSLDSQSGHSAVMEVYLCDDGSTDGTREAVREQFPQVHMLEGDGRLFWNGGMRVAFGAALQGDYDYYWWLNDDTHLDEDALVRLLDTARRLEQRGEPPAIVVGSTRHPHDGRLTYGGAHRPSRGRPLLFELVEPGEEPRPAETMNGNCVLVPREVAHRLGNIDPAYRQKMGDFDYGLRARRQGFGVWVMPGTVATCATHPPRRAGERPLAEEVRRLWSVKELPTRPWATFTRRYGGPLWPLYFASPYVQGAARLLIERLRTRAARFRRR